MTTDQLSNLKRTITVTSYHYGKPLPDVVIASYAKDLDDLDYEAVMVAIVHYRKDPKNRFMFNAAQIRGIVTPQLEPKDVARETAVRIREAVTIYGWNQSEGAREYLGDSAWLIIQRFGGWRHVCENLGVNLNESSFIAQTRDLIESRINLQRAGADLSLPALEQAQKRISSLEKFKPLMLAHKEK